MLDLNIGPTSTYDRFHTPNASHRDLSRPASNRTINKGDIIMRGPLYLPGENIDCIDAAGVAPNACFRVIRMIGSTCECLTISSG